MIHFLFSREYNSLSKSSCFNDFESNEAFSQSMPQENISKQGNKKAHSSTWSPVSKMHHHRDDAELKKALDALLEAAAGVKEKLQRRKQETHFTDISSEPTEMPSK